MTSEEDIPWPQPISSSVLQSILLQRSKLLKTAHIKFPAEKNYYLQLAISLVANNKIDREETL